MTSVLSLLRIFETRTLTHDTPLHSKTKIKASLLIFLFVVGKSWISAVKVLSVNRWLVCHAELRNAPFKSCGSGMSDLFLNSSATTAMFWKYIYWHLFCLIYFISSSFRRVLVLYSLLDICWVKARMSYSDGLLIKLADPREV